MIKLEKIYNIKLQSKWRRLYTSNCFKVKGKHVLGIKLTFFHLLPEHTKTPLTIPIIITIVHKCFISYIITKVNNVHDNEVKKLVHK